MQLPHHREASTGAPVLPPLVLLAGGLATRLGSITDRVPKSLLPVAGEPFVAHQLRLLTRQGVTDVVICCGHLGHMIEDFVGDGARFGCRVRYSHDGPDLLGTGGAIRRALPLLCEHFWVMYGDSFLAVDFAAALAAFHNAGKAGLMTVFRNEDRWDASNVEFVEGRIIQYIKRPQCVCPGAMKHIDYGLGLYEAQSFLEWPDGAAFDLAALQSQLVSRGEMAGFETRDRFYEIGSLAGLRETDAFLRARPAPAALGGVVA